MPTPKPKPNKPIERWLIVSPLGECLPRQFTTELDAHEFNRIYVDGKPWRIIPMRERITCQWKYMDASDSSGNFDTGCGHSWSFTNGGIEENSAKFCLYCGGQILAPEACADGGERDADA